MSNDLRGRAASASEVDALRRQIMEGVPRAGELARHYDDVKHLKPEVASIDALPFTCDITAGGVITQPSSKSLPSGFYAELFEVRGFMQYPGTDPELAAVTYFNIKDRNRSGDMLSEPVEMSHLVDVLGGGQPLNYPRGMYVFDPASRVEVKFSIDGDGTLGYANLASAAQKWGVLLVFNLYAI